MKQSTQVLIKKHSYFNQKFFAKWARLYDYEKYILFPIRKRVAELMELPLKSKIIDVAAGTGAQSYMLAKKGYDVIGLDLSPEMLQQAQKKLSPSLMLKFIHADATRIPFNTNMFDGASISLGLHDMPHEIRLLVLNEIRRVVRPKGHILIIDYLEPHKGIRAYLLHLLVRKLETPMYQDFIRRGLNDHLKEVDLKPFRQEVIWGGVQVKVCVNDKKS